MHCSGESGLDQVQGGLYFKKYRRLPVDSLFKAANENQTTYLPKERSHFWESAAVHALFDLELLADPKADVFYDIFSAANEDECIGVLSDAGFYDDAGNLSSDELQKLIGQFTIVYKKDNEYVDIHVNFMKAAVSEPWLYQRILFDGIDYEPLKPLPNPSARARAGTF